MAASRTTVPRSDKAAQRIRRRRKERKYFKMLDKKRRRRRDFQREKTRTNKQMCILRPD